MNSLWPWVRIWLLTIFINEEWSSTISVVIWLKKLVLSQKMALKVRHHPRNLKIFWNFFQFSQNKYSWSIGVIFDHLTKLSAISDQSRARYRHCSSYFDYIWSRWGAPFRPVPSALRSLTLWIIIFISGTLFNVLRVVYYISTLIVTVWFSRCWFQSVIALIVIKRLF